ncbi:hypothetical protein PG994_006500 [Apiospora phragmitis]|uniref:Uncharacterized protein n=1 Tax=Apiospora phragmitis TaxID=2905665 RepID=A0ABR1VF77_9PEZI
MTNILLFCTAEEARSSRHGPAEGEQFREHLAEGETFTNDFSGASIEECGAFELEQQEKNNAMDDNKIVLVGTRSAQDKTVALCYYVRDRVAYLLPKDKKGSTWYAFRIPYPKVFKLVCYQPGDADETWGAIFHRKEELTDEHGIFDLDRATELIIQGEGDAPGLEDYG